MAGPKKIKLLTTEDVICDALNRDVLRDLISFIGNKWSLSVIGALAKTEGNRARFSQLEQAIEGISQRMLSTTLRDLERYGLVTREVFPEVPPRVEYELTDMGDSLTVPIKALVDWLVEHQALMLAPRDQAYFDDPRAKLE